MKKLTFAVTLMAGILGACGTFSDSRAERGTPDEPDGMVASEEKPAAEAPRPITRAPGKRESGGTEAPSDSVETQGPSLSKADQASQPDVRITRKIIRDADLGLESEAPEESQKKIAAIVEGKGGFVVETQQSTSNIRASGRDTVTMTLRVPADKFSESIDEIRGTVNRVLVETVKGQDVTEEFIDIQARLKAKRALEARFLEIMKRATSVEDALKVESQLSDVRTQIEQIEGRMRFLENRVSLSTIKARIQTPAAISESGRGFLYKLTEAASSGYDAALNFVLGLITVAIALAPFVIFIVLPAFIGLRYLWGRYTRHRTAQEIAGLEIQE